MKLRNKLIGTLFALFATAFSGSALADADDNAPDSQTRIFYEDVRMLAGPEAAMYGGLREIISSATDVDYIFLSCGKRAGAKGIVTQANIVMTPATGDLDIEVYGIEGNVLGGSFSTTKSEQVDLTAAQRSVVVMRVYGYHGATGDYSAGLTCM